MFSAVRVAAIVAVLTAGSLLAVSVGIRPVGDTAPPAASEPGSGLAPVESIAAVACIQSSSLPFTKDPSEPQVIELTTAASTDERFHGDASMTVWDMHFPLSKAGASQGPRVMVVSWLIRTDDGAWRGPAISMKDSEGDWSTSTMSLTGEGAYEGYTAVVENDYTEDCSWELRGLVFEGELPHHPPAAAPTPGE